MHEYIIGEYFCSKLKSSTVSLNVGKWSLNDLNEVLNIIWEARAKWYHIGLGLELRPGDLDAIRQSNAGIIDDCFTEMVKVWLRSSEDTSHETLANALQQPTVNRVKLAEIILGRSLHKNDATRGNNTELFSHLQSILSDSMTPQEITKLKCQLSDDAEKINTEFSRLILYVIKSFNQRGLPPSTLASHILQSSSCCYLSDTDFSEKIMGADSIDRIMLELRRSRCISFINYHLLEFIIQEVGTADEKEMLEKYLISFKQYCRRCLFEVPQYMFDKPVFDGLQFALKVSSEF